MPCPYLAEVTMVFCRASPVRKLIPSDRVSTASHCDGETFGTCPLFVEALARAGQMVRELDEETQCSRCTAAAVESKE
ncbi:MAG TPA: hypothetical protein VFK85_10230 [Anaeromyxobacteraceae bacterium]|nr:hypothetical protein [Anaeromyxobacteraceae bacterium]